jgi:hypothetical protein
MMRNDEPVASARSGFWLLIALLALVAGGKAVLYDTLDPDCFWHLRVAAQLHHDGVGPIVDDLSFASIKQPWTPYSWLAELGMKSVWDAGGYRAAIAVTATMQGLIVFLLAMSCLELQATARCRAPWPADEDGFDFGERPVASDDISTRKTVTSTRYLGAAVATAIGTFLILPYLSFRPVTAAFVLLFTIAWLIARDQRIIQNPGGNADARPAGRAGSLGDLKPLSGGGQGLVWFVVPLTILLTNIHLFSFFVPAIALAMAIGAVAEKDVVSARRYSQLATATVLACLATPMLPGLLKTLFFYSANDKMVAGPVIAEMQSFARGPMGWVAAVGVVGMLTIIAFRARWVKTGQLICIAAVTLLMLKLGRFAPLFALAACPALAATLPGLKDRLLAKPAVILLLGSIVAIGSGRVVRSFPGRSVGLSDWVNRHGKGTPGYPCAAADFLDHSLPHPSGHLINEFSWGGYLAWRLQDKYQVLLDGRTQVYPDSLWQATYLGSDTDCQKFLAGLTADAALVPAGKSLFRHSLIQLGWRSVFKDDRAEVLVPPSNVARAE